MHLLVDRDLAVDETTNTATKLRINLIFICWPVEIVTKTCIIKTLGHIDPKHCVKNEEYGLSLLSMAW